MNTTSYWSSNTSRDGYYTVYTGTSTAGDGYGGYSAYYSYPSGHYSYKPAPAPAPIAIIEKETDLDDVLGWMKRGENIGKMAEIMKMMEEEING